MLAYRNTLAGLGRIYPNVAQINAELNDNWVILTEGVQTVLRRAGEKDPYSLVAGLSRGQRIGQKEWQEWVDDLSVDDVVKGTLRNLTPETYIGEAERLTDMALEEISSSRSKS